MAQINAWSEDLVAGPFEPQIAWALDAIGTAQQRLRPDGEVDLDDWRDPRVGWGILVPDDPALGPAERGQVEDQPEPIRRLVEARNGSIFRYDPEVRNDTLLRYYPDGRSEPLPISGSPYGSAKGAIPRHLLIFAPPQTIPWRVQYMLGHATYVGRLWLEEEALARYVDCLLNEWATSNADPLASVVWTVDHGSTDITALMRRAVAHPVSERIKNDTELAPFHCFLDGHQAYASGPNLIEQLAARRPGLVVTTSHGATGPLNNPDVMGRTVGSLVDDQNRLVEVDDLLDQWAPDGAIWYAHACCSAGTDAQTRFGSVPDSRIIRVLEGVAALGARVAPFAQALLSAERPLRAFVGHVEPTFDISLRHAGTGKLVSSRVVEALYPGVYHGGAIGRLLDPVHREAGMLAALHSDAMTRFNQGDEDGTADLIVCRLRALDAESLVIIGDPTVALTLPAEQ